MTNPIPANKNVESLVQLPSNTYKVNLKTGAVSLVCTNLEPVILEGGNAADKYADVADLIPMAAHPDLTVSHNKPGDPTSLYASVVTAEQLMRN